MGWAVANPIRRYRRPGLEPGPRRRVVAFSAGWQSRFFITKARDSGSRLKAGTTRGVSLGRDMVRHSWSENQLLQSIYVLLPAAVETGSTSVAARSGVSSFQRTDPNGRSSIRLT